MKDDMMREIEQYEKEADTAKTEIREAYTTKTSEPAPQQTSQTMVISGFLGILVLLVFAGGLIGAICFSDSEPRASVICVGAIFFTIGMAVVLTQKITLDNLPVLIFPIVGACMIIIPALLLYSEKHEGFSFEISEQMGANCALGIFVIVGLGMIFIPRKIHKIKMDKFSDSVMATCIGLDSQMTHTRHGHRTRVYLPTWTYDYRGRTYTAGESAYTNVGVPTIGEVHKILIDPNDPEKVYRPVSDSQTLLLIMGLLFAGLGGTGIIIYNFSERFGMNCMFLFFMLIGLGMMIVPKKSHNAKLKKFSDSVMATCVYLSRRRGSGSNSLYAPTWEYTYNGISYTHKETTYSNVGVPKVGDLRRLLIDPSEPQKIYRPAASQRRIFFLIGLIFVVIGLYGMINFNFLQ